ncbi:hypothetical protein OCT59_021031 [Rhizophagus irregularis]|nr:hypothetical protein OCT59_021031 [Rhizophagus irregularis]
MSTSTNHDIIHRDLHSGNIFISGR